MVLTLQGFIRHPNVRTGNVGNTNGITIVGVANDFQRRALGRLERETAVVDGPGVLVKFEAAATREPLRNAAQS
jgi:hypothetical protein